VEYCEGRSGWACTGLEEKLHPALPNGKLPLFGLDKLAQFDAATVWLTEGEKGADYVNNILKPRGIVAVSASVYGAITDEKSALAYDWEPLRDRRL
jgi:hypothetical protein